MFIAKISLYKAVHIQSQALLIHKLEAVSVLWCHCLLLNWKRGRIQVDQIVQTTCVVTDRRRNSLLSFDLLSLRLGMKNCKRTRNTRFRGTSAFYDRNLKLFFWKLLDRFLVCEDSKGCNAYQKDVLHNSFCICHW